VIYFNVLFHYVPETLRILQTNHMNETKLAFFEMFFYLNSTHWKFLFKSL
jgi:hypothetical protein